MRFVVGRCAPGSDMWRWTLYDDDETVVANSVPVPVEGGGSR